MRHGNEVAVPLIVGRMVHQFDHRYASVGESDEAEENDAVGIITTPVERANPAHVPEPRYFVPTASIDLPADLDWFIAYRDIARVTDARTCIATIIPRRGAGHTLPILPPDLPPSPKGDARPDKVRAWERDVAAAVANYRRWAPLWLANMNALPFDYIARQKVQSTHLSFYILEQMPVIPRDGYGLRIGTSTAEAIVRDHVLRLSYTAHDLAPFARDQGHAGPPFAWDEEERLHLRARLDALYFLLYGLDREGGGACARDVSDRGGERDREIRAVPVAGAGAGLHERAGGGGCGEPGGGVNGVRSGRAR